MIKYLFISEFYRRIQPFEHVLSEKEHWLDASSYSGRDFIPPTRSGNNPQRVHLLYRLSPPKVLAITADKGRNSSIQPRWNKRQTILRETISAHEEKKSSQREFKPTGGLTQKSGCLNRNIFYCWYLCFFFVPSSFCVSKQHGHFITRKQIQLYKTEKLIMQLFIYLFVLFSIERANVLCLLANVSAVTQHASRIVRAKQHGRLIWNVSLRALAYR